jgi:hypothetical protein
MRESTWHFRGPVRVACQQLGRKGWLIQNYNDHAIEATMHFADDPQLQNALTGEPIVVDKPGIKINLPPRGRLWIKKTSDR